MTMIKYNVMGEDAVRKSPETKQSQRLKHEHCNKIAGSSRSPNTLRATLGERTHTEKAKPATRRKVFTDKPEFKTAAAKLGALMKVNSENTSRQS